MTDRCGEPIKAKLGPLRIPLHCTLKPGHALLGMAEHMWVWEDRRFTVSAPHR